MEGHSVYLERMTGVHVPAVHVVVDDIFRA